MGCQLTYADREFLLRTFDSLKDEWNGDDEGLLVTSCEWAKQLVPNCGFEHSLTRDITVLSRYLSTHKAEQDIADIARGGLLYVMLAGQKNSSRLGEFGLLDDAFIASYAVHEIRTRLGEQTTYNPPRLTYREKKQVEDLFLELAEQPLLNDHDLIVRSRIVSRELANLAACGLFQRLQKNIDFLISVIDNSNWKQEQKCYANAALHYLICEKDVIDDHLGLIGYLDDNFMAQMAVDLIEPARDPWLDLLDATVEVWPFLNALLIDDGSGERPVSEFIIINSALSCAQLRREQSGLTVLILPFSGPTPFLLGFIKTLGLIQQSGQRTVTEEMFCVGQKVLVDNNAVAEFSGFIEHDGRRLFGLTQYYQKEGQRLRSTHYWPISDLRRLVPADISRVPRGQLVYDLSNSDILLPALEYLFNASTTTAHFSAVAKKVIVVMPIALAHDLAKGLRLHGYPLKDVIPMGHLVDNQIRPWSNRFGQQEPLLVFASDLDEACIFAERINESIDLVIINGERKTINKTVSLNEMQHLGIRMIVVTSESAAGELPISNHNSIALWEWNTDDFNNLLWPQNISVSGSGAIARYEHRLRRQSSTAPQVKTISYPLTNDIFESVKYLQSLARQRGEDQLADLDETITLAFYAMSRLFRSATPMTKDTPSFGEIEQNIEKINKIEHNSRYLSEREKTATNLTKNLLKRFLEEIVAENPKANALTDLLRAQPNSSVICPDARIRIDLELTDPDKKLHILDDYYDTNELGGNGVIIPGWFKKNKMARLLVPPVTEPIFLILYDIEQRWYNDFCREQENNHLARASLCDRSKLFPAVHGWTKPNITSTGATEENNSNLQEIESINEYISTTFRQHAYRSVKSDGSEAEVPARLVMFEGEAYAFLRESFRANVVTHLLDATIEATEGNDAEVKHKIVNDLVVGDALLFHRRSDRDVIRMVADKELPENARETASLWQRALIEYAEQGHLDYCEVWQRLKQAGCPLQQQTIRIWLEDMDMIAPRQYERDVCIIAKVTEDPQLNDQIETVLNAIRCVFSAHQRASHKLACQVLECALEILKKEHSQSRMVEIESDIVLVRIVELDDSYTQVRASMANRLQESSL